MYLTEVGRGKFFIKSIFALSNSIPSLDTICPHMIPLLTMKWHFSLFKINFASWHHCNTKAKFSRHSSKKDPKIEKVIHEYLNYSFHHVGKNYHHETLQSSGVITQSERYPSISECTKWLSKGGLFWPFSAIKIWL